MRTFSKDVVEYMEFQIEGDKRVYKIPLASSLTNEQLIKFYKTGGEYTAQVEWLRDFLGNMVDSLTANMTSSILQEWAKQSKDGGAEPGES